MSNIMKIVEGYNNAIKNYGYQLPNLMYKSGIGKNYIDAACKFYTEGVPIEQLQDDFKKWNRYVLNNPSYSDSVKKILTHSNLIRISKVQFMQR